MEQAVSERGFAVEVRRFVTEHHRRRRIAITVHVGVPGGARRDLVPDPGWDAGLRADVLGRLLDSYASHDVCSLWLSRGGGAAATDADLAWLRAARVAGPARGLPVESFVVVTRAGWWDLLTGRSRTWARARPLADRGG
ncbi:hypothetical protein GCM10011519_02350 [Marmoricola endophyticus]|uniref:Uncharacterized protein n=1 Tax=Marmoricola endophyticus TaxID=2040280 RepID=A0A917B9T8_9ACTN|nr:hypothetical protein [Marmoricola endophyticus]GGF32484.1 hypothetical protein GCM10011519_02350 [Marmoricola endophyticus]